MSFGLPDEVVAQMRNVFSHFPDVEKVILYGSRAKGTQKPGSDIDLALVGLQLDGRLLGQVESELDDLLLPYRLDLSLLSRITHAGLLGHIQSVGKVLYEQSEAAAPVVPR